MPGFMPSEPPGVALAAAAPGRALLQAWPPMQNTRNPQPEVGPLMQRSPQPKGPLLHPWACRVASLSLR